MKKKIFAICLMLVMGLNFMSACGKEIDDNERRDSFLRDSIEDHSSESSEAINDVENADDTDDYSSNAEEQILSIINDAEKFANNNNYDKAIDKIEAGLVSYPDSIELQSKLDEYTTKLAQQNKQKILDDAAVLASKEDYLGAMKMIEAAQKEVPDDADYEIAYDNYCSAYEDSVIAQADALAANNDYEGAIALVEEAQENVNNSTKLEAIKENYALYLPAEFLYNLQYTKFDNQGKDENQFFVINGTVTTFLGETYDKGLLFNQRVFMPRTLAYNLNASYTRLKGKISMIEKIDILGLSQSDYMTNELCYVEFIGDGVSLYKSPLSNLTADIDFDIDVSNVSVLEIKITPEREGNLRSGTSYLALTGLELYK